MLRGAREDMAPLPQSRIGDLIVILKERHEARRIDARRPPAAVVPIGAGARDVRPAPRLDRYDALLAAGSDR